MFIFICLTFLQMLEGIIIYIPLCLYLYVIAAQQGNDSLKYLHSTMFIFILFALHLMLLRILHLHSTMFIFI